MAVVVMGLVAGAGYYYTFPPAELLDELASQELDPGTRQSDHSTELVAVPAQATCPAPDGPPSEAVVEFVEAISSGNYSSAWSKVDNVLQQSKYQSSQQIFEQEWAGLNQIDLGRMTYSSPSQLEAILIADLQVDDHTPDELPTTFRLQYSRERCQWLISGLEPINVVQDEREGP